MSDATLDLPPGFVPMPAFGPFHDLTGPYHYRQTDGATIVGLRMADKHRNRGPGMHGGMVGMLIDNALTLACKFAREPAPRVLTTQLSISFIGTAEPGDWVEARTEIVRAGRRIVFANCAVWAKGKRIAQAGAQFQVIGEEDGPFKETAIC